MNFRADSRGIFFGELLGDLIQSLPGTAGMGGDAVLHSPSEKGFSELFRAELLPPTGIREKLCLKNTVPSSI